MMKKIVVVLVILVSFSGAFAQNRTQEKKIKYFVEAATKEFSLNVAQSKELLAARTTYITNFMEVNGKVKSDELSDDDKKAKLNDVNNEFNAVFYKITGKSASELKPFFVRMRDELKNI